MAPSRGQLQSALASSEPFTLVSSPSTFLHAHRPHLAILDSSFNPPTTAHLAIASSSFPAPAVHNLTLPYTDRLLLYSKRNAEKTLAAGDATDVERLEMMLLLSDALDPPAAVGLCSEPTFVGKSIVVRDHLEKQGKGGQDVEMTFLIGTDTLTRFFEERFYPPGKMEELLREFFRRAYLVSATRGGVVEKRAEDLVCDGVGKTWVEKGRLRVVSLDDEYADVSSTKVRKGHVGTMVVPSIAEYIQKEGLYR